MNFNCLVRNENTVQYKDKNNAHKYLPYIFNKQKEVLKTLESLFNMLTSAQT